jgi:hypothetical protein
MASYPMLFAHLLISLRELKGAWSEANCARNKPGPLIVFIVKLSYKFEYIIITGPDKVFIF